jgi:hypothetical protein
VADRTDQKPGDFDRLPSGDGFRRRGSMAHADATRPEEPGHAVDGMPRPRATASG